jgi:hypothetical protein
MGINGDVSVMVKASSADRFCAMVRCWKIRAQADAGWYVYTCILAAILDLFFFMVKYLKSPENNNRFCCFDLESGWGETPLEAPDRRLHPNTGQSVDRLDKVS